MNALKRKARLTDGQSPCANPPELADAVDAARGDEGADDWFIGEWIRAMVNGMDEWEIAGETVRLEDVRFD